MTAGTGSSTVQMADEVCIQMHLLNLSFVLAVGKRTGTNTELATGICTKQLIGLAAVAAERIHRALGVPGGINGAMRVLELHPLFNDGGMTATRKFLTSLRKIPA